jgi:hypothetical protein
LFCPKENLKTLFVLKLELSPQGQRIKCSSHTVTYRTSINGKGKNVLIETMKHPCMGGLMRKLPVSSMAHARMFDQLFCDVGRDSLLVCKTCAETTESFSANLTGFARESASL